MIDFSGFTLIGGSSKRMGKDKFSLPFRNKTLLDNAADALEEVCQNRVKIVLNQTQNIETQFPFVRDIYAGRGALGGIHAAVKNCESEFAIVLAVDLPFVNSEIVRQLAEISLLTNEVFAVIPRQTDGRIQPLCAVYRAAKCLSPLEKLLNETDKASVRDFLALVNTKYVEQKDLQKETEEDIFFNVNKPLHFQLLKEKE